jgi:hypothetical protein
VEPIGAGLMTEISLNLQLHLEKDRRVRIGNMPDLDSIAGAKYLIQIFASIFLAILFLQSGIDKIVDRQGNFAFLKGHFANSPLAGLVGPMFVAITVLEISAGTLSALGCLLIIFAGNTVVAFYGAVIATIAIIALFFGQRLAKDYPGAAVLVPYFILSTAAVFILA